jgi:hypothetical protein
LSRYERINVARDFFFNINETHFNYIYGLILECVQLIEQCLSIRSSERPTLEQCLQSEWLKFPSSKDLSLLLISRRRTAGHNHSQLKDSKSMTGSCSSRGNSS